MADLIDKVWAIDIGREGFTGFNAQHGLQVVTHTLCSSCGQGHNGHIRELLLQNTKLLVVRPAGIHVCVIGTVTVMAIIIALFRNSAGVYVAINCAFLAGNGWQAAMLLRNQLHFQAAACLMDEKTCTFST